MSEKIQELETQEKAKWRKPEDWFKELKQPEEARAMKCIKDPTLRRVPKDALFQSLTDALQYSFDWTNSPQKYDYWKSIHNKIKNQKYGTDH